MYMPNNPSLLDSLQVIHRLHAFNPMLHSAGCFISKKPNVCRGKLWEVPDHTIAYLRYWRLPSEQPGQQEPE